MNKKGFTLIELLAVIVILAIIALIATPIILNVIKKSKEGSAVDSAYGYMDAVEKYITLHDIDNVKYSYNIKNGTYDLVETTNEVPGINTFISIKGSKPTSGEVTINKKGKVEKAELVINNYIVSCENGICMSKGTVESQKYLAIADKSVTKLKTSKTLQLSVEKRMINDGITWTSSDNSIATVSDNGLVTGISEGNVIITVSASGMSDSINITVELSFGGTLDLSDIYSSANVKQLGVKGVVYLDPNNLGATCNASNSISANEIKTGCMKWYIYNDSGDTYKMILDHNTTAAVAWNSSRNNANGMKELATALSTDTQGWSGNPRIISAEEIAEITNTTTFNKTTSTYFYLDGTGNKKQTLASSTQGASPYAWLYDYTYTCTSYGCNIADSRSGGVLITGYWTSTPVIDDSIRAWSVYYDGRLFYNFTVAEGQRYGVRPVIEISKSIIN